MSDAAAFAGTYSDLKLVKSRSVAQVIVELPIEHAERFIAAFGMPIPGAEKPVALALLRSSTDKPAASAQQRESPAERSEHDRVRIRAVMLCKDKAFQAYCGVESEADARLYLLGYCKMESRSDLGWSHEARAYFEEVETAFRQKSGRMAEVRG